MLVGYIPISFERKLHDHRVLHSCSAGLSHRKPRRHAKHQTSIRLQPEILYGNLDRHEVEVRSGEQSLIMRRASDHTPITHHTSLETIAVYSL